jgi:hypothetical protein
MKNTIFNGKIHYKLPFSIAMFVYQRVLENWILFRGCFFLQWLGLDLEKTCVKKREISRTFGGSPGVRPPQKKTTPLMSINVR